VAQVKSPYDSLYCRLVANTHEPANEQACWYWSAKLGQGNYARFQLYVPGLKEKVTLMAHIALWVWLEAQVRAIDDFYLAYLEFVNSGLEIDHTCVQPPCINPDHLQPVTPSQNNVLKFERRKNRGR
jgi:hypothetical protein